jgi:hypothetical protein
MPTTTTKERVEQALSQLSHKMKKASGMVTVTEQGIGSHNQESYIGADIEDESRDNFSTLCIQDKGMHDTACDNDFDNYGLDDESRDDCSIIGIKDKSMHGSDFDNDFDDYDIR